MYIRTFIVLWSVAQPCYLGKNARRFDTFRHRASSGDQAISQEGPSLAGHHLRHHGRLFFPDFPIRMHFKKFRLERFFLTCGEMFSRVFQVVTSFCACEVWYGFRSGFHQTGSFLGVSKTPQIFKAASLIFQESPVPNLTSSIFGFWSTSIKLGDVLSPIFHGDILSKKYASNDFGLWSLRSLWRWREDPKKDSLRRKLVTKRKAQSGPKNQL